MEVKYQKSYQILFQQIGLEVVYYQDFTPILSCSNLFSQYLSIVSGSFSGGSCQYQCQRSDNGNHADIFSTNMSNYPSGFQMIKSITKPYSFFGVNLVYLVKDDPLNMNIFDGNTSLFSQNYSGGSTGTNVEYNYRLKCSFWSGNLQVSKETVQLNQYLASDTIKLQFKQHVTSDFSWYGVLKLRAWANCVENCNICLDNTNCSSCLQGFDRYTLQSGQKVCEQTQDCNITNCFSCIKSPASSLTFTCVKCLPGYSLDTNKNCIANTGGDCPANQYQSMVQGCQAYSSQCFLQKQNTYFTWLPCPGQVNLSQYKCLNFQSILIYEHKNYSLYTCGCPVNNCIQCPNPSQCSQCQLGYTYDPISLTCTFVICPVLYSHDPQTGLCSKNCSGNDCQQCDQNQQCTLCNPTGNFYIETANPVNCALCTIQNCSSCSGEGLCQQCQNYFSLSLDRTACNPCNVKNCSQCVIGQPSLCQTCIAGYIQSSDKTTCSCSVQNCQTCNSQDGTICDFCVNGYLISLDKKQCSCVVPNCSQCIQSLICTCQVYGCQTCTPLNRLMCQICYSNFIISQSGSCLCNVQNCSQCSATDGNTCNTYCQVNSCNQCDQNNGKICISPKPGYTYDPISQTNKCNFANCKRCDPNDGKICLQCQNGYNFSLNQCQCNVQYCQKCDPLNGSTCQQCITEYHFNPTGQTVYCQLNCNLDNCKECQDPPNNKTQCKSCNSGYVLDPSTNQCVSTQCKVPQCSQCQPYKPNLCQTCNDKYNLNYDSQCILSIKNDFSVQQTVIQNVGYNITLIFKNQIVMEDQNFDSQLNICKNLNNSKIQMQFGSIIGGLVLPQNDQYSDVYNKKQENNLKEFNLKTSNENKYLQKIEYEKLTRQKQLQYKWSRYTNPQEEKSANIKNGISEVLLVIMQVTICFLVKDDESQREEDRFNIGWIIVGSASLILTIHIFSVVVDLLKGIYNLVKDFICTLIKPKAEIESLKQEKFVEEQNKQNKFLRLTSQISVDKLRFMKKKLSLVPQSQLDISMVSIQRHQIKQKQIIVQPKNNESNHIIELQKQSENCDLLYKQTLKDEENQIKKNDNSF
ncbi:hypothetical protein TTHERM_01176650 (macronuclear) [Tetrahymena thermophila SB210]|uniref:EGF-like domain-containing protein n=1 Tax=Tetrahymena thermophila (strain SB210) TaxID=312017 RepID=Q22KZ1_TETTS|nr:hypothetical protein TTHERM_01176650 [Tetrahymena thermophila SB210]EAR85937.2 hypothetical protein TTHERM_01176650 [Tetrahymena thermophila SB210]|eukprot:XP_976532.2 hypothetical protein TTHERM_01176650 [Tetrahymena thermophila SB210]